MVNKTPTLSVKRLVVFKSVHVVYDEDFHGGLNIIRGKNSCGKSTILDFIFYALGGDVTSWKEEASTCTEVFAQISASGKTLTLKRRISSTKQSPMEIFWGPYTDAIESKSDGWKLYPYRNSDSQDSFSKIIFRAIGFPEVKNDLKNNITMHQVLRFLYVDQISRTTSLMREEDFDSPITRQTISEILYGVFNDDIYTFQLELGELERDISALSSQIKHAKDVLEAVGNELSLKKVELQIGDALRLLERINSELESTSSSSAVNLRDSQMKSLQELKTRLQNKQEKYRDITEEVAELIYEKDDTDAFIQNLEQRLHSLEESIQTKEVLSGFGFEKCPLCEIPLSELEDGVHCELSKRKIPGDYGLSTMQRMKEEIIRQIKEAKEINQKNEKELRTSSERKDTIKSEISSLRSTFNIKIKNVTTKRDQKIDELNYQKGRIEEEIKNLRNYKKLLNNLEFLESEQKRKEQNKAELADKLKKLKAEQFANWETAKSTIFDHAKMILENDLPRENAFQKVLNLDLDFSKNLYFINQKNNFSASSNAYARNAIHFAVHFASLENHFFRYPRFIMCDNVEDGGMEEERSQNFQKIIEGLCNQKEGDSFQIIVATSAIHKELDIPEYVVGEFYTPNNKSLKTT